MSEQFYRTGGNVRYRQVAYPPNPYVAGPASNDPNPNHKLRRPGGHPWFRLMLWGAVIVLAGLILWLSSPVLRAARSKRAADHPSESFFPTADPSSPTKEFGSIHSVPEVFLSVVVPAYNEEQRMKAGVDEMITFLASRQVEAPGFTWEIIIVDDGSKDRTYEKAVADFVASPSAPPAGSVRVLRSHANGGKGAAVRKGVMRARGEYILMADADGATKFSDVDALLEALRGSTAAPPPPEPSAPRVSGSAAWKSRRSWRARRGTRAVGALGTGAGVEKDGLGFAVGSRAHMGSGSGGAVQRSPLRRFAMWGFHTLIGALMGGVPVRDTQCGFKLWTRGAAVALFSVLHIERWAFDVELVFLSGRLGIPTVEVPVTWHEVEGSKLDVVSASVQMLRDIIVIRGCYALGVWSNKPAGEGSAGHAAGVGAGDGGTRLRVPKMTAPATGLEAPATGLEAPATGVEAVQDEDEGEVRTESGQPESHVQGETEGEGRVGGDADERVGPVRTDVSEGGGEDLVVETEGEGAGQEQEKK